MPVLYAMPQFFIFGVEHRDEEGCTLIVSDKILNFDLVEESDLTASYLGGPLVRGYTELSLKASLGEYVYFQGKTFAECFEKMMRHYAQHGGRFTEQAGLPAATPELEES